MNGVRFGSEFAFAPPLPIGPILRKIGPSARLILNANARPEAGALEARRERNSTAFRGTNDASASQPIQPVISLAFKLET